MATTHQIAKWLQAAADQTKRTANMMQNKYGDDAAAIIMKEHAEINKAVADLRGTNSTPIEDFIKKLS